MRLLSPALAGILNGDVDMDIETDESATSALDSCDCAAALLNRQYTVR